MLWVMCTACVPDPTLTPDQMWTAQLLHGTTGTDTTLAALLEATCSPHQPDRQPDHQPDTVGASWHTHLGVHLTAHEPTARAFAGNHGTVLTARLHPQYGRAFVYADEYALSDAAARYHLARGATRPKDWDGSDSRSDHTWLTGHPDARAMARAFADTLRRDRISIVFYGNTVEGPYRNACAIILDPSIIATTGQLPPQPNPPTPVCPVLQHVQTTRTR